MLTHPTLGQLQALGLKGMAGAYRNLAEQGQSEDPSREGWLALMLDREAAMRAGKRLANRLRAAKLRFHGACIGDIGLRQRTRPRSPQHPLPGGRRTGSRLMRI